MDVVLPTLAVALFWVFWGLVLAGCGYCLRRLLGRALSGHPERQTLLAVDLWIGLAGVVGYLLVWNLLFAITWVAGIAPIAVGAAGLVAGARTLSRPRWLRTSTAVGAAGMLSILWLANASLAVADDYDFGLYHLNLIDYAKRYATVPGLADLHVRLGAGDAHLLFVALLDRGPLSGAGPHLADGLLASLLIFDLVRRFAFRPASTWFSSFTSTLALLLIPTTVIVAALRPTQRISSPNLDFAAFVLVVIGILYLAECVEKGLHAPAALGATAALATAAATRPLYWIWVGFAIVVLLLLTQPRRPGTRSMSLLAVGALPGLIGIGWLARQAILSGYPLYPLTLGGLPVDWRLPAHLLRAATRADYAWARNSGAPPDAVLSSWSWLPHHWIPSRVRDPDVILPVALLAAFVLIVVARGVGPAWRERRKPMLVIVAPSLVSIAIWFAVIPDPRFVWGPIWLVPLALVASVLPPHVPAPRWFVVVAAVCCGIALAAFESQHRVYFVPAVALAVTAAAVAIVVTGRRIPMDRAAPWFVITLLIAELGASAVTKAGGFHLAVANHAGRIGIPADPVPTLVRIRTASGLVVFRPVGSDQCWQALVCVPSLLGDGLRLRGRSVDDGFSLRPVAR